MPINSKLIASNNNNTDLVLVNKREKLEIDSKINSKIDSEINSEINSVIDSNTRIDLDEINIISKEGLTSKVFEDGRRVYNPRVLQNNKVSIREDSTNLPSSPAKRSNIFDLKDDEPSTPAKSHEHTEKLNNVATRILDAFFGKPDNSPIKPTLPNINNKDKSPGK